MQWQCGEVNAFVTHYNDLNGTRYALSSCLDVVRISGNSPKKPEVPLTDSSSSSQMVIERKSVVCPPHYLL